MFTQMAEMTTLISSNITKTLISSHSSPNSKPNAHPVEAVRVPLVGVHMPVVAVYMRITTKLHWIPNRIWYVNICEEIPANTLRERWPGEREWRGLRGFKLPPRCIKLSFDALDSPFIQLGISIIKRRINRGH